MKKWSLSDKIDVQQIGILLYSNFCTSSMKYLYREHEVHD